jgi:multicomponent Na+:H+ antiporter subunit D
VITFLVSDQAVLAAVLIPFAGAALIPVFHAYPNLRETVTLTTAALLFLAVLGVLQPVLAGARPEALNLEVVPGLALAFKVEPLGLLFALIASGLWIITSIYSIGYMRGNNEPRQTSYYVCFAVALGSTVAIAFAKNLFTLFLFYEALTLSTYPLVTHKANAEAMRAGRIYLIMLLGTSMVLLLPAIVATWVFAGTIEFLPGGILAGKASDCSLCISSASARQRSCHCTSGCRRRWWRRRRSAPCCMPWPWSRRACSRSSRSSSTCLDWTC